MTCEKLKIKNLILNGEVRDMSKRRVITKEELKKQEKIK